MLLSDFPSWVLSMTGKMEKPGGGGVGGGEEWSGEAISMIVVMAKRGSSDYSMTECAVCFSTAASM